MGFQTQVSRVAFTLPDMANSYHRCERHTCFSQASNRKGEIYSMSLSAGTIGDDWLLSTPSVHVSIYNVRVAAEDDIETYLIG